MLRTSERAADPLVLRSLHYDSVGTGPPTVLEQIRAVLGQHCWHINQSCMEMAQSLNDQVLIVSHSLKLDQGGWQLQAFP
jgi:hypothetical protein